MLAYLTDSIVKQPSFAARILCGAGYAVIFARLPQAFHFAPRKKAKGRSAERRILCPLTPRGARVLGEERAPSGAPSRRLPAPGRAFAWTSQRVSELLASGSYCPEGGGRRRPRAGVRGPPAGAAPRSVRTTSHETSLTSEDVGI